MPLKLTKEQANKKIIEIIQKRTTYKVKRIGKNDDIYEKKIIDSFDLLGIIQDIESSFKIKIQVEKMKKLKFSINFLSDLVIKKIK
jgi:acyl carrier protein